MNPQVWCLELGDHVVVGFADVCARIGRRASLLELLLLGLLGSYKRFGLVSWLLGVYGD